MRVIPFLPFKKILVCQMTHLSLKSGSNLMYLSDPSLSM
jgi:hypothetical protein